MMNRIILGLGLGFMMWFSLFFMTSVESREVKIKPRRPVTAVEAPRLAPPTAPLARRGIASIPSASAAPVTAPLPTPALDKAARLSLADLRRLTFEKHQDLFARLVDPAFKPWAWLVDMQPQRRAQMQNFLNALQERGRVWSTKQEMISGDRTYEFESEFRIIENTAADGLRARVDLRVRFDGQELTQTSFEDEARISARDGRPYAMFDLSNCPTDLAEHFAIVLMAWPDGQTGSGDFRALSSADERWHRSPRSSWVELASDQAQRQINDGGPEALPTARSEACAFTPSWH